MPLGKSTQWTLIAVAIIWLTSCGCSSIRVPAIDPTGASVFAPNGSYTTLESPCAALLPASCLPRPAFAEPPSVAPCQTPVAAGVPLPPRPTQAVAVANIPDRLLLTPSQIVAPVGSEVVLLAGLSGPDGYFIPKQPVEWLLSQESVGHFVDVGEDDHPTLSALLHRTPEKRSSNFAIARTSSSARTITRGTPAPNDDIVVQKGQTWVTMTSASEGVSHVSAVATEAANWEQRRQSATIQWVDAQWLLPSPTVVRAGQSQILSTTINRSSSRSPVRGWLVRYEIVSGPSAGFGPERAQAVEVTTDANGKANVSLQPLGNEPGVTQVKIEILSPALSGLDGQPVVIGQGMTSVTWSAAGLAVRIIGPTLGAVGATLDYQIEVTNPGDLPTENVIVTAEIPQTFKVLGGQEGEFGANVEWRVDRLPPRGSQQFTVQCRAMSAGNAWLFARAAATGINSERVRFNTEITESALQLTMELAAVDNPNAIKVGDRVSFNIEVRNTSNVPLTNVQLRDTYANGLEEAHNEPNPISKNVGNLAPGASWPLAITFIVRQPGQLCHTLQATADGGHTASVERCITAGAPRYDFSMELRGPEEILTGETAKYEIVVKNTGDGELTGIRVVYRAPDALLPKRATENYRIESGALVWTIGSLGAGKSMEPLTILCDTVSPNNAAETSVLVSTEQGLTNSKRVNTAIRQASAPGVAPPGPARPEVRTQPEPEATPGPTSGAMRVSVSDISDPIRVGETVTYLVQLENTRQASDKNVYITYYLPQGAKFVSLVDDKFVPVDGLRVSPDKLTITMERPIVEIRPGEKLPPYRLQVEGTRVGKMELRVEVSSVLSGDQPVIATADTRVNAS
ncbi:MAG: DUF11 domain-containing protein [Planctomycetaceae bacterium]|nr:DUF11 domain-containing protein [Planctomycetaceae bacterium]MCB9940002.1 DUF11 domain-containing protein [Planctomycetaceae bacterium]